ncbi:hypothetical protein AVEN_125894-1, partial [Araneus ventricosus]
FSLVLLSSHFETTRGLFWDGPRNFEPWSGDEDDAWAGTPSPSFHATPTGGRLTTTYDLAGPILGGFSVEPDFETGALRP